MARCSSYEVQTQLLIAKEMKFGSESGRMQAEGLSNETERMLNSLMKTLAVQKSQGSKR
jgi:four helix bundle protein